MNSTKVADCQSSWVPRFHEGIGTRRDDVSSSGAACMKLLFLRSQCVDSLQRNNAIAVKEEYRHEASHVSESRRITWLQRN